MQKSVIASVVVAVALFGVIHASDLILGTINSGDRVLHSQGYMAPGAVNQTVSRLIAYNGTANITAIRAYDRSVNRTGIATLQSGGLGQRNATIFVAGYRHGIGYDYLVEIYGR
ncbi:uncharacterized protein LOC131681320 [Topomyia yanbarensis]|uniref:uncharacterized protein LOC131681320 n=1 Tax=Topomyia yanbarensis TaxID=2498891 RepID=UPI00273ACF73|nr:uncharacterized protein LOC131681320 [Topomyia yanbarensis]